MDFKLEVPLQVYIEKDGNGKKVGAYESRDDIVVSFVGKKGLKALKHMQDIIFKTFMDAANKGGEKKEEEGKKNKDMTMDDMLSMLDMTGNSERVFDSVMDSLKVFATLGKKKLDDQFLNDMDIDDIDRLCSEVLKSFLLPKIIQQMNNMKT